jgi:hypothetical protein
MTYWRHTTNLLKEAKMYFDLRPIPKRWNGHTRCYVHVCREARWDYKRTQYLKGLPNVDLISYPCNLHAVIRYLAKQKLLKDMFLYRKQEQLLEDVASITG